MGCGLDHLAFEKKILEFRCPLQRQRLFFNIPWKILENWHYVFVISYIFDTGIVWQRFFSSEILGFFFSIKIIIDKKLLKLLFADARYIWSVFLARRTICPDTIKNKCLANDVITEEFSLLFIAVGTLRRNTRPRTTFHEKEFRKKKIVIKKTS